MNKPTDIVNSWGVVLIGGKSSVEKAVTLKIPFCGGALFKEGCLLESGHSLGHLRYPDTLMSHIDIFHFKSFDNSQFA